MKLKSARYDAGLSLAELAEKAGVAVETLSRIESGKRFPNADTAKKIADALELKPSDLFFESSDPPPSDDEAPLRRVA